MLSLHLDAGDSIVEAVQEFLADLNLGDGEDILSRARIFSRDTDFEEEKKKVPVNQQARAAANDESSSVSHLVSAASSPNASPRGQNKVSPILSGAQPPETDERYLFDETTFPYAGLSGQDAIAGLCGLGDDYTRMGKLRWWFLSEYHVEVSLPLLFLLMSLTLLRLL